MKYFLLLFTFGISGFSHAQSILDSIFYLRIGMENCQFRLVDYPLTYQTEVDSMYRNDPKVHSRIGTDMVTYKDRVIYARDTTVWQQKFILRDNMPQKATLRFPLIPDTVCVIDPFTLEEQCHLECYEPTYQFSTELRYKDFIKIVKEGFELKNLKTSYKNTMALMYYETNDKNGRVSFTFLMPPEKRGSQLKSLSKGGLVLLSLKWADDYNLHIDTENGFIALIHIRK